MGFEETLELRKLIISWDVAFCLGSVSVLVVGMPVWLWMEALLLSLMMERLLQWWSIKKMSFELCFWNSEGFPQMRLWLPGKYLHCWNRLQVRKLLSGYCWDWSALGSKVTKKVRSLLFFCWVLMEKMFTV